MKAEREEKKADENVEEEEEIDDMSGFDFETFEGADNVVDKSKVQVKPSTKAAEQEEKKAEQEKKAKQEEKKVSENVEEEEPSTKAAEQEEKKSRTRKESRKESCRRRGT